MFKDVKVRKTWKVNPVTKVKDNKKSYNRNKEKNQWKKEVDEIR